MDSADLFQSVYVPVFNTKLAALGFPVRNDADVKHLLKIAGQLKALKVKSSLEVKSDLYKNASEHMANVMRNIAKMPVEKTATALDPTVLAGIAGLGAVGGVATNDDDRSTIEKGIRGAATGLGTVGGAALGDLGGSALSDIISKKLNQNKDTASSTKSLIRAVMTLIGGGAGYALTSHKPKSY